MPGTGRPTRALIDLEALRANVALARARAPGQDVIAVVKADAYGHGVVPVAHTLAGAGCSRFAVVTADEAAVVRQAGLVLPILVLGGVHDADEASFAVARRLTPVVHHAGHVELLADACRRRPEATGVAVHIEVDTGMRRMGVAPDAAAALAAAVSEAPGLALAGVFTHLAHADEPDLAASREQLARFASVLAALRESGRQPGCVHVVNSAGLLATADLADALPACEAVRPGLMLYGASPARHFDAPLRAVMSLRTRVVQLRRLEKGDAVGYGGTWRAKRPTTIATLPLGYADGVPRSLGNRGHVLLREHRLPLVGRVSMDYVTVDAGEHPIELGDEVVVFGDGDGGRLPVEEAADAADTLSYELMVRVGARVPRVVVTNGA